MSAVFVDSFGSIYVGDSGNDRVQVFDSTGGFLFAFGSEGNGEGQFASTGDIEVDAAGLIHVADSNNRVQVFDSQGDFLYALPTSRQAANIALDAAGNTYVLGTGGVTGVYDTAGELLFEFSVVALVTFGVELDASGQAHFVGGFEIEVFAPILVCPCLADITNETGDDLDGTINERDLLLVLENWGTDGTGSQIAQPFNVVDIFDLLVLLNTWGTCE